MGFCYLAAILDMYLRKCIGWSISMKIDTNQTLEALEMANIANAVDVTITVRGGARRVLPEASPRCAVRA